MTTQARPRIPRTSFTATPEGLLTRVTYIDRLIQRTRRGVYTVQMMTKVEIGRRITEEEQKRAKRTMYGAHSERVVGVHEGIQQPLRSHETISGKTVGSRTTGSDPHFSERVGRIPKPAIPKLPAGKAQRNLSDCPSWGLLQRELDEWNNNGPLHSSPCPLSPGET